MTKYTNKTTGIVQAAELDDLVFVVIVELKKDAKLSEQKLARKTGIPMTTVHNRIRKLRELGVIQKFTIELDYTRLGRPIVAYVLVKVSSGADQKEILVQISKIPGVVETAMITGDFDIIFKARIATMEELNAMVVQGLRKQKTIGDTRTMISYETIENR
jgi:Lrp/AsnC family transcriptional regulator for asnA, asnC and gidA